MPSRLLSFLLCLVCCQYLALAGASCYSKTRSDSVSIDSSAFRAKTVVVSAEKFLASGANAMMAQTSLPHEYLLRLAPVQVSDALQFVPGLFVRDYGGLGGLKTASIRSGSSAQTLVLIDGIRVTGSQNGQVDLGTIPASFIGSIDVLRGGASALYGANALTGVLQLNVALPSSTAVNASFAEGSFEEQRSHVDAGITANDMRFGAAVELNTTRGSFPYTFNAFGNDERLDRENGDSRNLNLFLCADMNGLAGLGDVYVLGLGRSTQRGVPGAVVQGNTSQANARLDDLDGMVGLRHRVKLDDGWLLRTNGTIRSFEQHYRDPDANLTGPTGIDERYYLRDATAGVTLMRTSAMYVHQLSVEAAYSDLAGGGLQPGVGDFAVRRSAHATASSQMQFDSSGKGLSMQGAMRFDAYSDIGIALSPLVAARYQLDDSTALRTSWSYNFRPPSFNELYYLNYGTSTLRPERSHTISIGGSTVLMKHVAVDIDAFGMFTNDLILSVPVSPVITSAQNVGRAVTYGIETTVRVLLIDNRLMGTWNYTLQDARDKTGRAFLDGTMLPYSPPEMFAVGLHWREESAWLCGLQWQYTSYRYSQPGGEPTSILAPYHLVSAYIGALASVGNHNAELRLSVQNLFDESYVVVRGYPMPGRMFRLSIQLHFI